MNTLPKDLTFRTLDPADIDAVTALLNDAFTYDHFDPVWVRHKIVEDPNYEPGLTCVVEQGHRTIGFGQAVVRDVERSCIKMVAVAPDRQRRGLGHALLTRLEQGLAGRSAAASVLFSRPNYFMPGLDPRYTPAASFLLNRGYEKWSDGFNMGLSLSPGAPFERQLADYDATFADKHPGLTLLRPPLEEEPRVRAWLATTGCSDSWQYQAMHAFHLPSRGPGTRSGLVIAALDGAWVGFAAYDATQPATFGPEWVSDDVRGRGVGKALLFEALRGMRDDGYTWAEIGLVGPLPFYAKSVGAQVSRVWWFFRKALPAS
jgi:mycothiol synthase